MSQRYSDPVAHERMRRSTCPECGAPAEQHSSDPRFWVRSGCDLTARGVRDRITQYERDLLAP